MIAVFPRRLKRLSHIYALGIGCLLLALTALCYGAAVRQYDRQAQERFSRECDFLCDTLATQPYINPELLDRMAASGNMLIAVEKNGGETVRLNSPTPDSHVVEAVWEQAMRLYAYDHTQRPNVLHDPEKLLFPFKSAGTAYRACLAKMSVGADWLSITILMDRSNEQRQNIRLRRTFAAGSLTAIAALGAVAWMYRLRAVGRLQADRDIHAELLSALSHELRFPLSSIRANTENMDGATPEEARRFAKAITEETARLTCQTDRLLKLPDLSEQGRTSRNNNPAYVLLTLYEHYEDSAREKQIALHITIPDQVLPGIDSDVDQLQHVLSVLVENALRYTPAGGRILLRVKRQGRHIAFTVADSGRRIDTDKTSGLFQRFYRDAENAWHDLDLSYVLEYCMIHSGELLVDDCTLGGAAFTVKIPYA